MRKRPIQFTFGQKFGKCTLRLDSSQTLNYSQLLMATKHCKYYTDKISNVSAFVLCKNVPECIKLEQGEVHYSNLNRFKN